MNGWMDRHTNTFLLIHFICVSFLPSFYSHPLILCSLFILFFFFLRVDALYNTLTMIFGRSGFIGCPVTKSLCFFFFASTLWSALYRMKKLFHFDFIMVFRRTQYWRVLTHSLAFMSSVELILGLLLLYTFRMFERRWGSRKFAVCSLFSLFSPSITCITHITLRNDIFINHKNISHHVLEGFWLTFSLQSFLFVTWLLSILGDVASLFLFSEQHSISCGPYALKNPLLPILKLFDPFFLLSS
jgi:hypothetical protein